MQVISGKYARRKFHSPKGSNVRPPLSRLRRALFDSLSPFLARGPFLDLFGGTGSFTIEAISRGAPKATIVEMDSKTKAEIQENIRVIGVEEPVEIILGNALKVVEKLAAQQRTYAVISIAPPYYRGLENATLEALEPYIPQLLDEDGLIFVQYATKDREEIKKEWKHLSYWKEKTYGNSGFTYFLYEEEG